MILLTDSFIGRNSTSLWSVKVHRHHHDHHRIRLTNMLSDRK